MEGDINHVIKKWMEGDINNLIQVWLAVYLSLIYCYVVGKIVPKGALRLLTLLPVVSLFLLLPLKLHSVHLCGTTAFFVTWLANFKLALFAFGKGPLSDPSISLPRFLVIACFPVKIQDRNPSNQNGNKDKDRVFAKGHHGFRSFLIYATKGLLLAAVIKTYDYADSLHPRVLLVVYCLHVYLCLELLLAIAAFLARGLLGLELEPQFNEPYLSTSLQDFWGRRWNLIVTRILRPTVYGPVRSVSAKFLGRKWVPCPAIMCTFLVSGLMHELILYYLGRVKPTWEITWFFLLHGATLIVEIVAKKAIHGIQLPRIVATPLTLGFVMVTGYWLFFPQFLRCRAEVRAQEDYAAVGAFLREVIRTLSLRSSNVKTII